MPAYCDADRSKDYKTLQTTIPGIANFGGKVVHPQFWPEDLDYTNKNVTIIGSGATSVTLFPAIAKKAAHVTTLQRSPSYLLSQPSEDDLERAVRRFAPTAWKHQLLRAKWIFMGYIIVRMCRLFPQTMISVFRKETIAQLPPEMKYDPDFKPSYNPFEQRVCFCPDGKYYEMLRSGKGIVVTGVIEGISKDSIKLTNGQELHPDIIITATGLKMQLAGGMKISVNGKPINLNQKFLWKNTMFQDVPNADYIIGYVDASWTLGADATSVLFCRMLDQMKKQGVTVVTPTVDEKTILKEVPLLRLSSTYVQRAKDVC
jgi:cation diffusion facilitator CzcD-associated flavoprotein CzcO